MYIVYDKIGQQIPEGAFMINHNVAAAKRISTARSLRKPDV
jgi:hypothetical protein